MSEYEIYHHGVKGMKWGVRKKKEDRYVSRFQAHRNASKAAKESRESDIKNGVSSISTMQRHATLAKAKSRLADAEHNQNLRESRQAARKASREDFKEKIKSTASKGLEKAKTEISKAGSTEIGKRGKAALDVLMNGDKDWMGEPIYSDNVTTEVRNRGKAAVERLLYSQEQIDNKKFFGRYNF